MNFGVDDIFEFWTPSEVKNYVATVGNGYNALAEDIGNNPTVFSKTEMQAWGAALQDFIKFYKNQGFFSSLSMGAVRTAENFATQLTYWRNLFTQKAGKPATGSAPIIPSSNQDKAVDTVKLVAIVLGIGATGYLVAQIARLVRR
jgi:hypothetical protein